MEPHSVTEGEVLETQWVVYCDRAWGATRVGAVALVLSPSGINLRYAVRMQINSESNKCTNSIAEYEAILLGLRKLRAIRVQKSIFCTDSKVVARQIEKEWIAREPTLERYLGLVRRIENYFKVLTIEYIGRNKICKTDELAKAAARNILMPDDIFFHVPKDGSVKTVPPEPRAINIIEGEDWRAPIMAYLRHYFEPDSKNKQIRLQQRAKDY
jgi:ribonuclease HI